MKTRLACCLLAAAVTAASAAPAQDLSRYSDEGLRAELAGIADAETAVLVPMRDGKGLSTNIWRPKGASGKLPVVLWKTPYDEHVPAGGTARYALEAVRRGYAFIVQNERGRYFSQGTYEILGRPQTDGYDTLSWIAAQPWSNGKVGTLGCSSSAEWQLALAGMNHPAHAAMVPMAVSLAFGILFATVITLLLVPCLYMMLDDLSRWRSRRHAGHGAAGSTADGTFPVGASE